MTTPEISTLIYNTDVTQPHIYNHEHTEQNGTDLVTYVWEVDESKPRIYIEGMGYKFNSTLISVRRVSQRTRH